MMLADEKNAEKPMTDRPHGPAFRAAFAGAALLLSGCAETPMGPLVQVMPAPGKTLPAFEVDLNECKAFAQRMTHGQASSANHRAIGGALLTTAVGAGGGALVGWTGGDTLGGAASFGAPAASNGLGGAMGASSSAQPGIQVQYDNAFAQCMYARGNQVQGYAPQAPATDPTPGNAPAPGNGAAPPAAPAGAWPPPPG
jgi:hypothetical protein